MGDTPTPTPEPTTPAPATPAPTPPTPAPTAHTVEEVQRIAAREKDQGRREATQQVTELLGCTPEEAKAILDRAREADRATMTEAERKLAEANEKEAAAATKLSKAAEKAKEATIKAALVAEGVPKDRLARVVKLVEVEGDEPSDDDVEAAVTALKGEMPELFGEPATSGTTRPPASNPTSSKPPAPKVDNDAFNRGLERAKRETAPATT